MYVTKNKNVLWAHSVPAICAKRQKTVGQPTDFSYILKRINQELGVSNKKLNIYSYNDFRKFLADYFNNRRLQMRSFSIRYFAQKAGIASHSFISAVIKGKRNLAPESRQKVAYGMGLDTNELRYFNLLVDFNQAKNSGEKQHLFDQLNGLRRNTSYYKLNKAHYEYLSKWYYFVIRELAVYAPWKEDFSLLASLVVPRITESEARTAVRVLVEIGFLKRNDDGSYVQTDRILTTKDIPGHLVKQARKQFIELSARASEEIDPNERNLGSTTLTLSAKNYSKAVDIMEETRRRIIALSQEDAPVHRVYQAHVHLFPLSKVIDSVEES
jgi:uncharacterized protein (TIGR02147 family)